MTSWLDLWKFPADRMDLSAFQARQKIAQLEVASAGEVTSKVPGSSFRFRKIRGWKVWKKLKKHKQKQIRKKMMRKDTCLFWYIQIYWTVGFRRIYHFLFIHIIVQNFQTPEDHHASSFLFFNWHSLSGCFGHVIAGALWHPGYRTHLAHSPRWPDWMSPFSTSLGDVVKLSQQILYM